VEGVKEMLALGDLTRNVHALSAFFESAVKGEGQRENSRSLVRCLPLRLDRLCLVCFELSLELLDVSLRLGRWDSGDVGFNLDLSSVTGRRWLEPEPISDQTGEEPWDRMEGASRSSLLRPCRWAWRQRQQQEVWRKRGA
jgi:hypothetical protein